MSLYDGFASSFNVATFLDSWFHRQAVSDFAGSASFFIWLFAQSPQLLENYRRGSVEGLSAVFIVQWMIGDAANLIGSVLTHQLGFQIAVATYFCCVDLCIITQYIYYYRKAKTRMPTTPLRTRSRISSLASTSYHPAMLLPYSVGPTETSELLPNPSSNKYLHSSHHHHHQHHHLHRNHTIKHTASTGKNPATAQRPNYLSRNNSAEVIESSSTYHALTQTARSVAQLMDEAARKRHHHHDQDPATSHLKSSWFPSKRPAVRRNNRRRSISKPNYRKKSAKQPHSISQHATDVGLPPVSDCQEPGEIPAEMLASITSHASSSSSSTSDTTCSRSLETETDPRYPTLQDSIQSLARGRDMARTANSKSREDGSYHLCPSPTPSDTTAKARLHQRLPSTIDPDSHIEADRTTVASLSTTDLGGAPSERDPTTQPTEALSDKKPSSDRPKKGGGGSKRFGMALLGLMMLVAIVVGPEVEAASIRPCFSCFSLPSSSVTTDMTPMFSVITPTQTLSFVIQRMIMSFRHPLTLFSVALHRQDLPPPPPTWDRVIGRMSAWTCTVLYTTSRIPQIWENHTRRSVKGLSILLFISAFLGNLTYTISILSNSKAIGDHSADYLQESIPFLIGSGGTLIFDLIIMVQWVTWHQNQSDDVDDQIDDDESSLISVDRSNLQTQDSSSSRRIRSKSTSHSSVPSRSHSVIAYERMVASTPSLF